jgi:hypothetical protein
MKESHSSEAQEAGIFNGIEVTLLLGITKISSLISKTLWPVD